MDYLRCRPKPLWFHTYLLPIYAMPILIAVTKVYIPICVGMTVLSALIFLSTFWNVRSELFQCFSIDPKGMCILFDGQITHLTVEDTLSKNTLTEESAKGALSKTEGNPSKTDTVEFQPSSKPLCFVHKRNKYLLENGQVFKIEPRLGLTVNELKKGAPQKFYSLFPPNDLKVPNPSFLTLFKEQCVTPLFCFQIFSSMLMCFDEYVLQSIFSTALIIIVEAGLVFARVHTISQFRTMEHKASQIEIIDRRGENESRLIASTELRPSDAVKITGPMNVPCDLLITAGSCAVNEAMLSGESVPLHKDAVPDSTEQFSFKKHKRHVLFSGTKIEVVNTPLACVALRTAFDTEQGILLNKMLSAEDIKYDPEALRFICMLTVLSLISSFFTFLYSKKRGYPLFIDIIVLFTNSIPFELPMEMGVSVQNAVKNLMCKKIHCLEPFRITLAGKVNVCCFDKTVTLTDFSLELKKIIHDDSNTFRILAACNGLINIDGKLRGDPLDESIFKCFEDRFESHRVLKKYPFSSELKRQAVLAQFGNRTIFAVKGAPEVVARYLKTVPDTYRDYAIHAAEGSRVIAMAYKLVDSKSISASQAAYENNLTFGGFVLFGCALKEYVVEMCRELMESNHRVIMITGDNLLTAKSVAAQLGIGQNGIEGSTIDELLVAEDKFEEISIFARADPRHKELIIKKYKSAGYCTMMVGDGTNDVGALKAADVGVAMLDCKTNTKDDDGVTKPGDASVAAPFTVKSNSMKSIIEIIQQGRTSLVTTIQMYKILTFNSITNAFFLTLVDILGVKFSEYQMISVGILSAIAFQAISSGRTLNFISKRRPLTTIFSPYILSSIAGQSIVHIGAFIAIFCLIPHPDVATKFVPSVMNTVLYLISCSQTIATFACNYIGRPFREDLIENKLMLLSILGLGFFAANIVLRLYSSFIEVFEVVDIGSSLHRAVLIVLVDSLLSYAVEKACFRIFMLQ